MLVGAYRGELGEFESGGLNEGIVVGRRERPIPARMLACDCIGAECDAGPPTFDG